MNPLLFSATAVTVAVVAAACSKGQEGVTHYHCPMHPTYTSDRAGDCPICGMDLVPVGGKGGEKGKGTGKAGTGSGSGSGTGTEKGTGKAGTGSGSGSGTGSGTGEAAGWTCPMEECDVHVAEPGECPKCGMKLVPESPKAAGVPGQATVETTPEARRLAGVRTAVATRQRIERTVRTVGTVVADESRIRHVHTKIEGWVDQLHVEFTGQAVRKGTPILAIYSQELLASQEEYLRAREAAKRFEGSSLPEVRKGGEDLVLAALRRLELFDVPKGFIERLERTGRPQRAVPVLSPASGVVTAKQVFEGQQVDPGMELFTVTDLSRVWIEADLYENEAGRVRVGDEAVLTLAYDPGVRRVGRVKYVYPYLNPETRTLKVRFDFANPDGALKPAMYANVQIALEAAEGLVVPDSAVMDTGVRQVAFVAGADGGFEPREVQVGIRADGLAQVVEGLKDGERVATAANFLLDSESRLRSAIGTHP